LSGQNWVFCVGIACVGAVTPAHAQHRAYAIPAQPVEVAIATLAHEAKIQIVASQRLIAGKWANPVTGAASVEDALTRMLLGTDLTFHKTGAATYAIIPAKPAPPAAPPPPPAPEWRNPAPKKTAPAEAIPAYSPEILVTGSLLATGRGAVATPTLSFSTTDMLDAQPSGVIENLFAIPSINGSINTTSNVNTGGFNTLNLRGIGSLRGLLLIDGRRLGPTQNQGQVDVDVIPQILLKRVDVVTGGASATYGSDAVSGVVNFLTDTQFTGLKVEARGGLSRYGDDRKMGLGVAWGASFGEQRGHVEIGYEYADNAGFLRASRPLLDHYASMVGSGTAAAPYSLAYGTTLNSVSFGGLINSGPLAGLQFAQNGMLSPFSPGTPTATSAVNIGGDGAYFKGATAGSALVNHRAMARADFAINDSLKAHATGILSRFTQSYTQQNPQFSKIAIGYNNAYLASVQAPYQAIIAAQPADASFQFSKMDLGLPNFQYRTWETYLNLEAGLAGEWGRFAWDMDGYIARSTQWSRNAHGINLQHLWAAANAVNVGGRTVCHAALGNPNYADCVPINLFGPTSDQADAIAYITQPIHTAIGYATQDVNARIRGRLFDLPAGPVKAVAMGEWRRLTYRVDSNATPNTPADCAGVQFNCGATDIALRYMGGQTSARSPVSQTVSEIATEFEIPLLADRPYAHALNLNGAARFTHYDTSGSVWTWKAGLVWVVWPGLTLRGTRSRDIRAPNLYDLLQPTSINTTNYTDLHTNTSGIITQLAQGNPSLRPEKADTWTMGVAIRPRSVPGLSLTMDFYAIRIHQALVNISAFQPATQAACENSGGTASVCALYVRPLAYADTSAANFPTLLLSQTLNVASLSTYGVDVDANYATRIGHRPLTLRALVTYQPSLRYNNGPSGWVDVGGAADGVGGLPPIAALKTAISASLDIAPQWSLRLQHRFRDSMRQHGDPTLVFNTGRVKAVSYLDLNVKYQIRPEASLFLNVQNLLDTKPPVFASTGGSTQMNYLGGFAQGDDIEGRYITVGLRAVY
jgi:iron complex outermembrane receptor protein